jgi:hypothetical protein
MTKDEMHEREPLNIIMRYKAQRTTEAEAAAEIRAYVAECMRRADEPQAKPAAPVCGKCGRVGVAGENFFCCNTFESSAENREGKSE